MLLHVFVGDGQLVKPPGDLLNLTVVVKSSGGYGKGGREFEASTNWSGGTFVRFHSTVVVGDIDAPECKKLTFELKGCYKDSPANLVSLGVASLETNPKQKARTAVLELTNYADSAGGNKTVQAICKLSVTLFHNRFAIELSPDEVVQRHTKDKVAQAEAKAEPPGAKEYSFLLSRRINWESKKKASFNKDTEKLLDQDVYKNLKDFQRKKRDTAEYKSRHRHKVDKFSKNQPKLAYYALKKTVPKPKLIKNPYRSTILGVGFVGDRINPTAAQLKEEYKKANTGKVRIPFSKNPEGSDHLGHIYSKILSAEQRRQKRINKLAKEARFRVKQDRVRTKIIAQRKAAEKRAEDMRKAMVAQNDAQLNALRVEINRRKREVAFLAQKTHDSEANARKKAAEEAILQTKREARDKLEKEAREVMSRARSPQKAMEKSKYAKLAKPDGPRNAIPLRNVKSAATLRREKEKEEQRIKEEERKRQEKLAFQAKARMLASVSKAQNLNLRSSMPVERNRVPLRSVNLAAIRKGRAEQEKRDAAERRSQAIAAAIEAEEVMRDIQRKEINAKKVNGVKYTNPYPIRKVNVTSVPIHGSFGTSKPYDFAGISKTVASEMTDDSEISGGEKSSGVEVTYPFTYTLKTGTVLKARTLEQLQAKILTATRKRETQKITEAQKKRAYGIKSVSDKITSASEDFARSEDPVATPLEENVGKKAPFYDPEYKPPNFDDLRDENATKDAIDTFTNAVDEFTEGGGKNWIEETQSAMNILTSRSEGISATSEKIDNMSYKMSADDSMLAGSGSSINEPGFLNTYKSSDNTVETSVVPASPGGKKKKGKKGKKETQSGTSAAATAAASNIANEVDKFDKEEPRSAADQDEEDLNILKKHLEAQGVTVDSKMEAILQSLKDDSA